MNHLVADNAVQVLGGRGVTQTDMGRVVEVGTNSFIIIAVPPDAPDAPAAAADDDDIIYGDDGRWSMIDALSLLVLLVTASLQRAGLLTHVQDPSGLWRQWGNHGGFGGSHRHQGLSQARQALDLRGST